MLNLPFVPNLALFDVANRRLTVRSGLAGGTARITAGVTAAMLALAMVPTEAQGQSMEAVTGGGELRQRLLNDGVTGQRVPGQMAPFSPGGLPSQTDIFGISSSYRLGIGDVIGVSVFGAEEYGAEVIVLQDGTVNLPRIGQVFVLGQTLREAETTLAQRYATFIRQPMVSIASVSLRPVRISIAGAVRKPGSYTVQRAVETRDNNIFDSRFPTLTEAIAQAGGITGKANIREIELRRPVGYNDYEVRTFDLWDLIQTSDLTQDVVLQSGDEVFVPTAVAMLPSEANAIADASFAPEAMNVYVAGEVDNPGFQQLPLNTPLNQAILNAGNFNPRANRSVVQLVRVNPDGTVTQREINVDLSAGVNEENNPILTEEDVIIVGRSGLTRFGDATSIVLSPVTQILNTILGLERLLF